MTRASILGFSLLLATGCAPATNTRAQDLTWAAYRVCRTSTGTNVVVTQVHPDGCYSWIAPDRGTRVPEFEACMREEVAKGARPQAMTAAVPTPQLGRRSPDQSRSQSGGLEANGPIDMRAQRKAEPLSGVWTA
jgi:hypothetical protein